jgi:hypothetical protein
VAVAHRRPAPILPPRRRRSRGRCPRAPSLNPTVTSRVAVVTSRIHSVRHRRITPNETDHCQLYRRRFGCDGRHPRRWRRAPAPVERQAALSQSSGATPQAVTGSRALTPGAVTPPGAPAITDPRTDPSTNQPRMGCPSSPGPAGSRRHAVRAASPTKRGSGATGRGAKRQQRRLCDGLVVPVDERPSRGEEWGATGDRARHRANRVG